MYGTLVNLIFYQSPLILGRNVSREREREQISPKKKREEKTP